MCSGNHQAKDELNDHECSICHRLHEVDDPCPLRIANALTMRPRALEQLTASDMRWIKNNPDFSVLDTLEDAITDLC